MIPSYPSLLALHVTCVATSGALFVVRWVAMFYGAHWPGARGVRRLSYGVDTLLLAAGATMAGLAHLSLVSSPWLAVKLLLLVVYVILGSFALKRARTRSGKLICFVSAITTLLFMVSIAVTKAPLGIFSSTG